MNAEAVVRTTKLPSGEILPVLGQGMWYLGESRGRRKDEIAALRTGLDLGMNLIDTAEMYGDGAAEELVGEAIASRREEVFLVSKVLPNNATRHGTVAACERSLHRLCTDRVDLYLLRCECIGYQCHTPKGQEVPSLVMNSLVNAVKFTGNIGVVGVFVPKDPGGAGAFAKKG